MFKRFLSLIVISCFIFTSLGPLPKAYADTALNLPAPGTMVNLSPAYQPVIIKGLTVHKENPFIFDFIVDVGQDKVSGEPLKKEGEKLIKYFLASLAIPDKDVWVNLSPYEKNRMIPDSLSQTDMGRDLLEQDYILKQITASLIYPEKELGRRFWDSVYSKAQQMYGTTQIPVNTFNKVWIMADRAEVFEHGQTAFVVDSHLKVMLEEDYLALQKHTFNIHKDEHLSTSKQSGLLAANIIRSIILPELEKEVNTGKNFANLRQIFNSIILSSWFKKNLREALLNQVYADKAKVKGINLNDPMIKEQIYEQYLKAYKKGVFNYIKDDASVQGVTVPRKYFSGGLAIANTPAANPTRTTNLAMLGRLQDETLVSLTTELNTRKPAMPNTAAMSSVGFTISPTTTLGHFNMTVADAIKSILRQWGYELSAFRDYSITLKGQLSDNVSGQYTITDVNTSPNKHFLLQKMDALNGEVSFKGHIDAAMAKSALPSPGPVQIKYLGQLYLPVQLKGFENVRSIPDIIGLLKVDHKFLPPGITFKPLAGNLVVFLNHGKHSDFSVVRVDFKKGKIDNPIEVADVIWRLYMNVSGAQDDSNSHMFPIPRRVEAAMKNSRRELSEEEIAHQADRMDSWKKKIGPQSMKGRLTGSKKDFLGVPIYYYKIGDRPRKYPDTLDNLIKDLNRAVHNDQPPPKLDELLGQERERWALVPLMEGHVVNALVLTVVKKLDMEDITPDSLLVSPHTANESFGEYWSSIIAAYMHENILPELIPVRDRILANKPTKWSQERKSVKGDLVFNKRLRQLILDSQYFDSNFKEILRAENKVKTEDVAEFLVDFLVNYMRTPSIFVTLGSEDQGNRSKRELKRAIGQVINNWNDGIIKAKRKVHFEETTAAMSSVYTFTDEQFNNAQPPLDPKKLVEAIIGAYHPDYAYPQESDPVAWLNDYMARFDLSSLLKEPTSEISAFAPGLEKNRLIIKALFPELCPDIPKLQDAGIPSGVAESEIVPPKKKTTGTIRIKLTRHPLVNPGERSVKGITLEKGGEVFNYKTKKAVWVSLSKIGEKLQVDVQDSKAVELLTTAQEVNVFIAGALIIIKDGTKVTFYELDNLNKLNPIKLFDDPGWEEEGFKIGDNGNSLENVIDLGFIKQGQEDYLKFTSQTVNKSVDFPVWLAHDQIFRKNLAMANKIQGFLTAQQSEKLVPLVRKQLISAIREGRFLESRSAQGIFQGIDELIRRKESSWLGHNFERYFYNYYKTPFIEFVLPPYRIQEEWEILDGKTGDPISLEGLKKRVTKQSILHEFNFGRHRFLVFVEKLPKTTPEFPQITIRDQSDALGQGLANDLIDTQSDELRGLRDKNTAEMHFVTKSLEDIFKQSLKNIFPAGVKIIKTNSSLKTVSEPLRVEKAKAIAFLFKGKRITNIDLVRRLVANLDRKEHGILRFSDLQRQIISMEVLQILIENDLLDKKVLRKVLTPRQIQMLEERGDQEYANGIVAQKNYRTIDMKKPAQALLQALRSKKIISNEAMTLGTGTLTPSAQVLNSKITAPLGSTVNGGIDLSTSNGMRWKDSKVGKGVEMPAIGGSAFGGDIDPAMLALFKRQGIEWLKPVVIKMTPVRSIWSFVGVQAPAVK